MVGGNRLREAEKAMCLIRLFAFFRVGKSFRLFFTPVILIQCVFRPMLVDNGFDIERLCEVRTDMI